MNLLPFIYNRSLLRLILLLLVLGNSAGCRKAGFDQIEPVVDRDLVTFQGTGIPEELDQVVEKYRILILGKPNFVQEHHDFNQLLLEKYGREGLLFFNEYPNALNWMVEDYVTGAIDYLPTSVRQLNDDWLEKIRDLNGKWEGTPPLKFIFNDVNHSKYDFQNSLKEAERLLGAQKVFTSIRIMKPETDIYARELEDLLGQFQQERESYVDLWGPLWYDRFTRMIEHEIESNRYRTGGDEDVREQLMVSIVETFLNENPGYRAFINSGMNHAQKEAHMGPEIKRLGGYLQEIYPGELFSIAFIGISGQRKYRFEDVELVEFNILESAGRDDLTKIVGEKAGRMMSLLPLQDPVFSKKMNITYTSGTIFAPPAGQFDALVTYPEISILESLDEFKY